MTTSRGLWVFGVTTSRGTLGFEVIVDVDIKLLKTIDQKKCLNIRVITIPSIDSDDINCSKVNP